MTDDEFDLAFKRASKQGVCDNMSGSVNDLNGDLEVQIEKSLKKFLVNGIEHNYESDHYIFKLAKPIDAKYRRVYEICNCCKAKIKKSKCVFCEFCGKSVCKKCILGKREFRLCSSNQGKCCIVCDRKFDIDDIFTKFKDELANINNIEVGLKATIKYYENEYNKYDKDLTKLVDESERKIKLITEKNDNLEFKINKLNTEGKEL